MHGVQPEARGPVENRLTLTPGSQEQPVEITDSLWSCFKFKSLKQAHRLRAGGGSCCLSENRSRGGDARMPVRVPVAVAERELFTSKEAAVVFYGCFTLAPCAVNGESWDRRDVTRSSEDSRV
ncbi:hypothetical protein EYF80_065480 [Liparis tanakae]|uniref:Uncharacterized protein n=1 Tax=Liparis tanakae TaxID=230148 RepID=A0A4Z2E6J1_9TELE|nr:hypothetical protein EYF80_065480 [Liparis tanakae]